MSGNHAWALIFTILPLLVMAAALVARQLAFRAGQKRVPLGLSFLLIIVWAAAVIGFVVIGSEGQPLFQHSRDYWLVGFVLTAISGMVLGTALFQPVKK